MKGRITTRREAMAAYVSLLAGSPLVSRHALQAETPAKLAPLEELVNTFEVEAMAQRKLDSITFSEIAGSDRAAFDRITFRPRVMVNTKELDMGVELFGESLFAPILVGPTFGQNRFHKDGEREMVRGAGAAKTVVVAPAEASQPLDRIAAEAKAPIWYQIYPGAEIEALRGRVQAAVKAGCKAICLTLGTADPSGSMLTTDWSAIDRLKQGLAVPFLLKGIMTPEEARTAVQRGVQGIIVSNYRGGINPAFASPIEVLPEIAEAVGGKIPILIDGSFRRGGDVLKAIALGARAVLLGRPPLWGLAAYGADGVRYVLELMQAELARAMVMCGKPKLKGVDRAVVRIHRR